MDFHGCKRKRPAEELSRISFIGVCMAFKSETPSLYVLFIKTVCTLFVVRYRIYPVSWGRCVSTGFSFLWHYVANWHLEATVRTNAGMVSLKPGRGKKAGNMRINVDFKNKPEPNLLYVFLCLLIYTSYKDYYLTSLHLSSALMWGCYSHLKCFYSCTLLEQLCMIHISK